MLNGLNEKFQSKATFDIRVVLVRWELVVFIFVR